MTFRCEIWKSIQNRLEIHTHLQENRVKIVYIINSTCLATAPHFSTPLASVLLPFLGLPRSPRYHPNVGRRKRHLKTGCFLCSSMRLVFARYRSYIYIYQIISDYIVNILYISYTFYMERILIYVSWNVSFEDKALQYNMRINNHSLPRTNV